MTPAGTDQLRSELAAAGASGTWHWDIPGDVLHVDAKFAELYSLDPTAVASGLPTKTFFQAIHPDDKARIRIAVAGILAGAETFSKEFRVVGRDGLWQWVHGRGQCHFDAKDQPIRFTGLLVDVTERKRTEERLRIAQTAGGVGTFEYIDGFATASVSEEFCRLLGLHPASVLPVQTINGVLSPGQPPLIPGPRGGEVPTTLDSSFEIVRNDDGEHRWIARRGEILREGSGYRLVGVIYDVTSSKAHEAELRDLNETLESRVELEIASRRNAENALRQAQKMEAVGQLTGGIAHDFNNLLMAISSSLDLLRKRIPDDPQLIRLIDNALQGSKRGAALTQRMLAFARRQDLTSELVDMRSLISGMLDLMRRTLGPAWPVTCDFPGPLPTVLADANQLEMAILNLAVNARDAMPDGGDILVTAEDCEVAAATVSDLEPGHYLRLKVIDTGTGMDDDTLTRAIEPFFTTKGVGKGTGLGLSMIHGLARQLGGSFTLESRLGEGTTASLWLPAAAGDVALDPVIAPESGKRPVEQLSILAVDDDPLILMNTAALLEDLGHKVYEASSGEEALGLFKAHGDIDLVVTDHAMPGMTGTQLAERLEILRPNIPLILATGYGELPVGFRKGAVKLGKPFSQAGLADALVEAMSQP
ncbi:MAG TPA: ATP-binding protein [Sphingopyxis sp.]|uniref:ATP-binding protein n=1 Tax=Sphingopyxis sp. TaxID=1908224 RepID=UPI002BB91F95|nr:ATP-binding protein [Sphingopyxis sp.]HWW55859.1 ATP-binding protein [Sphingopyxis sp.]